MVKWIKLLPALLIGLSSLAQAQDILVFTDTQHTVYHTPPNAKIIYLDKAQRLENDISEGLPVNTAQAAAVAKQRLANRQFQQELAHAYQGIVNAYALGVIKIPAVVVANRYVIYGQPDIQQALNDIRQYMETQQ